MSELSVKPNKTRNSISLVLLATVFSGISGFNHAWADDKNQNTKLIELKKRASEGDQKAIEKLKQQKLDSNQFAEAQELGNNLKSTDKDVKGAAEKKLEQNKAAAIAREKGKGDVPKLNLDGIRSEDTVKERQAAKAVESNESMKLQSQKAENERVSKSYAPLTKDQAAQKSNLDLAKENNYKSMDKEVEERGKIVAPETKQKARDEAQNDKDRARSKAKDELDKKREKITKERNDELKDSAKKRSDERKDFEDKKSADKARQAKQKLIDEEKFEDDKAHTARVREANDEARISKRASKDASIGNDISDSIRETRRDISDKLKKAKYNITQKAQDVKNRASDGIKSSALNAKHDIQTASESTQDAATKTKQAANDATTKAKYAAQDARTKLGQKIEDVKSERSGKPLSLTPEEAHKQMVRDANAKAANAEMAKKANAKDAKMSPEAAKKEMMTRANEKNVKPPLGKDRQAILPSDLENSKGKLKSVTEVPHATVAPSEIKPHVPIAKPLPAAPESAGELSKFGEGVEDLFKFK